MKKLLTILSLILLLSFHGWGQSTLDNQKNNVVKLYPNPANRQIQIKIENNTLENPAISLHTLIGNKMAVKVEILENDMFRIDIAELPSGYYFVAIKDKEFNRTYKFLKN